MMACAPSTRPDSRLPTWLSLVSGLSSPSLDEHPVSMQDGPTMERLYSGKVEAMPCAGCLIRISLHLSSP